MTKTTHNSARGGGGQGCRGSETQGVRGGGGLG